MTGIFLWLSAIALSATIALGLGAVGSAAIDDERAETAADSAALAGAAAGYGAAIEAAAMNNAELLSVTTRGSITTVVVRVGRATATAHAERILVPLD